MSVLGTLKMTFQIRAISLSVLPFSPVTARPANCIASFNVDIEVGRPDPQVVVTWAITLMLELTGSSHGKVVCGMIGGRAISLR